MIVNQFISFRRRWHEVSLTVLLVVQIVMIFGVIPASAAGLPIPPSLAAFLLLLFMSLTITMARGRWAPVLGVTMLVLSCGMAVMDLSAGSWKWKVAEDAIGLLTFVLLALIVLHAVFGPGRFTNHRIRGAVVLYLNLGLMFAFVHRIVAEVAPGAYKDLPPTEHVAAFRAALDYLSFITLTSVGYGDITPVHPLARALCMLEAAMGQLLPTLLIARVMTIALQSSRAEEESSTTADLAGASRRRLG